MGSSPGPTSSFQWNEPEPSFNFPVDPQKADDRLIGELLKRVGGGQYDRELLINRKTVTSLGLVIPPDLLLRADKIVAS